LGFGWWVWGVGVWVFGPQPPIPNPQSPILYLIKIIYNHLII